MITPKNEEPGFETDVNELPDSNKGPADSVENKRSKNEQKPDDLEKPQKEGAVERKEGGLY